jgi:hypothetical protein
MSRFSQRVLFFVHVPKTAGTTMRIVLLWLYWWNQLLWAKGNDYLQDKAAKMSNVDLSRVQLVAGHTRFGMHTVLPFDNFQYFTILREPVERVLSQCYYMAQKPTHRLYQVIQQENLSTRALLEEGYISIHNVQTYWISGADISYFRDGTYYPDIIAQAKQNIDQYFTFVGLNEHFDESLVMLKHLMGWKRYPIYAQKNVTGTRRKQDKETEETVATIRRFNQMDLELYDYAAKYFHQQLAAVKDADFDQEVAQLRRLNQRYGRWKPYRLKILSGLVSQKVQSAFSTYDKPEVLP